MKNSRTIPRKPGFLMHMHYFRAFAILNIMFVHILEEPHSLDATMNIKVFSLLRETLLRDTTFYFIFISGFLFQYLSKNFSVKKYYKSKLLNVITPYLILSTLIFFFNMLYYSLPFDIFEYSNMIILGKAQFPYWYIPFISLVFLISPLLLRIPKPLFAQILCILVLLPLLGTRTGTRVSIGQFIYFFPTYMLGMYFSMNYTQCMEYIKKHIRLIAVVALAATILFVMSHAVRYVFHINMNYGFFNVYRSISYVQKMAIIFLGIYLLEKIQHKDIPLLDTLANYSFALYFFHTIVDLECIKGRLFTMFADSLWLAPVIITYALLILAITLGIAILLKRLLGKRSRMFMGA